jgi:UDP-N-acetylmuramate--alanine ligase
MYIPKVRNLHFVGIGGSGMSGIAEVLLNMGYHVSGSDLVDSAVTERLRVLGGAIAAGHAGENIGDAQVVVTSSAVKEDNPEVVEAHRRGIPVIPRAEMLAELMRMKYSVAVAGAHGKTTVTSMVSSVLDAAGLDPTAVVGGKLAASGSNVRLGQGEFLVAEADESDGSFLRLFPTWAVVTNIDREHLDYYTNLDAIQEAFVDFAGKVPFYGCILAGIDSPPVREILPRLAKRIVTFGLAEDADIRADGVQAQASSMIFDLVRGGEALGRVTLPLPGVHNVLNSLAAAAVGLELDLAPEKIIGALEGFRCTARRFDVRGEASGVMVVDDYGHHPAEIRATLAAARAGWERRIVAVFQPHRYSRSRDLEGEFDDAFDDADLIVTTEIYAAGEDPVPGVTGENIHAGIVCRAGAEKVFIPERGRLAEELAKVCRAGDLVITLGAGDIWKTAEELPARLENGGNDERA